MSSVLSLKLLTSEANHRNKYIWFWYVFMFCSLSLIGHVFLLPLICLIYHFFLSCFLSYLILQSRTYIWNVSIAIITKQLIITVHTCFVSFFSSLLNINRKAWKSHFWDGSSNLSFFYLSEIKIPPSFWKSWICSCRNFQSLIEIDHQMLQVVGN